MSENICQVQSVPKISEGLVHLPLTFKQRIRILMARWFSRKTKHRIKAFISPFLQTKELSVRREGSKEIASRPISVFQEGEWVQVRSFDEIEGTLDRWRQLKGCGFIEGMESYCGTKQRVLKPVKRFVDERDYHVKHSSDLYILDGLMCQGTEAYGKCDRSCLFFWRGEWLSKENGVTVDRGQPELRQ